MTVIEFLERLLLMVTVCWSQNVQGYHVANESRKYKKAEEPAPAILDTSLIL